MRKLNCPECDNPIPFDEIADVCETIACSRCNTLWELQCDEIVTDEDCYPYYYWEQAEDGARLDALEKLAEQAQALSMGYDD